MRKYCEECGKEVDAKMIIKKEIYAVCGENIEVDAQVLVCADCGEEFYSEELDNATLTYVYDKYRKKHRLLFPEEIKKIREQYGLSQRSFANLLNWGDKTICRYENGSIPDKAHNSLLLFLREPGNMRTYLTENEITLNARQQKQLLETVAKLERNEAHQQGSRIFTSFFIETPCEGNGFKVFDYDKFCAMVLYFAHRNTELLKTKLMKLLNYSDMIFYKENGISISGVRYRHLPYGPVPEKFDSLLDAMEADHIAHLDISYDNGYEKHQVVPEQEVPKGALSEEEMKVMERVYEKFANFGSVEISNYSHKEAGYNATKQGDIISYSYAKEIELG